MEKPSAEELAGWERMKSSKAPVPFSTVWAVTVGAQKAANERLSEALAEAVQIMRVNGDEALEALQSRDARIDSLETRIAKLEQVPLEYCGTYESAKTYRENQFVSFAGSLWAARCSTRQRPADGSDWQLAVKHGRDAR